MHCKDIYNSILAKVASITPLFAKALVDLSFKEAGLSQDNFTPIQLLDLIDKQIDPRLRQQLGENYSVLTAGAGIISLNAENTVLQISPILLNMFETQVDRKSQGKALFTQLAATGLVDDYGVITHLQNVEKFVPSINRYLNIVYLKFEPEGLAHAIIQDITIKKHLELGIRDYSQQLEAMQEQLAQARDKALAASKAKSEFLARVSHELRTPMNAILGFGQLLEIDDQLGKPQMEQVHEILKAGRHLLDLINEVLDLTTLENNQIRITQEAVNCHQLLLDCVTMSQPIASQNGIALHYDASHCKTLTLKADRIRLKEVILNLISNAIKYNRQQGKVTIDCSTPTEDKVRISVTDTGPGLTKDQLQRLFQPFERLGAEYSNVQGTGIGLSICKRIVELMGGNIGTDSTPAEGSTFWVELNRSEAVDPAPGSCKSETLATVSVLYIEDNPANLRLMEHILKDHPHLTLLTVMSPLHGLQLARSHRPALILLAIDQPEMSAAEILQQLQQDPVTQTIPVVAITPRAKDASCKAFLHAGFSACLAKPIDIHEAQAIVDKYVTNSHK